MASKKFTENDLAAFAREINWVAERVMSIDELVKPSANNPVLIIADRAGEMFHSLAQEQSPKDTGLLQASHLKDLTFSAGASSVSAVARIFIDPDPSKINWKYGGYPGDYGPRYHAEKRTWFAEAFERMSGFFDNLVNEQISVYFEGFWD